MIFPLFRGSRWAVLPVDLMMVSHRVGGHTGCVGFDSHVRLVMLGCHSFTNARFLA